VAMEADHTVDGVMLEGVVTGVRVTMSDEQMMMEPPADATTAAAADLPPALFDDPLHQFPLAGTPVGLPLPHGDTSPAGVVTPTEALLPAVPVTASSASPSPMTAIALPRSQIMTAAAAGAAAAAAPAGLGSSGATWGLPASLQPQQQLAQDQQQQQQHHMLLVSNQAAASAGELEGFVQPSGASEGQMLVPQGSVAAAAAAPLIAAPGAGGDGAVGFEVGLGLTGGAASPAAAVAAGAGEGVEGGLLVAAAAAGAASPVVGDVSFTMGVAPVASTRFATHRRSASTGMVPNFLASSSSLASPGLAAAAASAGDGGGFGGGIRSHSGTQVTPGPEGVTAVGTLAAGTAVGSLNNSPAGSLQGSPTRPNEPGAGVGVFKAAGVYGSPGLVTQGSGAIPRAREGSPNKGITGAAEGRGMSPAAAAAIGGDVLDIEMSMEGVVGGSASGAGTAWVGHQGATGYPGFSSSAWSGNSN
jgi:hypothetical protein